MSAVATATDLYRAEYEGFAAGRPAGEPAWLRRGREAAILRFQERGFPTTSDEDWRFTSVAPIARANFRRSTGAGAGPARRDPAERAHHIVFVDGRYSAALSSLPAVGGPEIRSLAEVLSRQPARLEGALGRTAGESATPFADLNRAFLEDGALVVIPPGLAVEEPIRLTWFSTASAATPTVSHPRTLVLAGRGSQCRIVESYGGPAGGAYFTNAVSEIALEDGAVVDHYKLQHESEAAFHVGLLAVSQGRSSRFASHSFSFGAALARTDIRQLFAAEGGECVLNGLFVAGGEQLTDTHTFVDHAHPHCTSRELYKGIVDGKARGVFVGRVLVRKDAQKTDAHQTNKNLLLSREALVDSVPQLEILANDVKCKHGSTTGQLDPAALFYLRSRGIREEAARSLLVNAFAGEIVGRVAVPLVRAGIEHTLRQRLPGLAARELQEAVL